MITEIALLNIRPGSEKQFEAAFEVAVKLPAACKGYLDHELRRSVETPNRYVLIVQWRTLEDHTVGFRGSPVFAEWRAYVGPFFESPPVVEHFRSINAPGGAGE
jgi:heme-degrading monooxygenase HmoA